MIFHQMSLFTQNKNLDKHVHTKITKKTRRVLEILRKEQAIKDFIEARRICRNQIFIMNKDNGHFVSIEPNDHSKQNNFY